MRKAMTTLALAALLIGGTTLAGCAHRKGAKASPHAKASCPCCQGGKACADCPKCAGKKGAAMDGTCTPAHPCPICKAVAGG